MFVFGEYKVTFGTDGKTNGTEKGDCPSSITYVYKTYGDTDVRTSRPTNKKAYLRYVSPDGITASETDVEACVYSETYGGELCLKKDEFSESVKKIKKYFGFTLEGSNAWNETSNGSNIWKNSDETITCTMNNAEGYFGCDDSIIMSRAYAAGAPEAWDYSSEFMCAIAEIGFCEG